MKSLTPKKVALAIGVSESSMKRWCDRGMLQTTRTAGGHRRLTKSGVIQFLRNHEHRPIDHASLGLPEPAAAFDLSISEATEKLYEFLTKADERSARSLVIEQYIAGRSIGKLFDEVIAPAFHRIGDKWECGDLEIYHERRSCEACMGALAELEESLPEVPDDAPVAMGGAPANDIYTIPSRMVRLVLKEKGWKNELLGTHIPLPSFAKAAAEFKPLLVWMSVSHVQNEDSFVDEFNNFAAGLPVESKLVIGGRELNETLRSRMNFEFYCQNLQEFEQIIQQSTRTKSTLKQSSLITASDAG